MTTHYTFRVYEEGWEELPTTYDTTQLENLKSIYEGAVTYALEQNQEVTLEVSDGENSVTVGVWP